LWSRVTEGYGALPAFGLLDQVQIGDTGPVESARRSNSRVLGPSFSGLAGQYRLFFIGDLLFFIDYRLFFVDYLLFFIDYRLFFNELRRTLNSAVNGL
jgi:hypothetical protein